MKFLSKIKFLLMAIVLGTSLTFVSCDDNKDDGPDGPEAPTVPTVTKTIADVKALAAATAVEVTEDVVIEGVVISNDSVSDNFYRKVYIQSGVVGFALSANKAEAGDHFYKSFVNGQKVVLNLKGLHVGLSHGGIIVGKGVSEKYVVGLIPDADLRKALFKVEGGVDVTPVELAISEVTDAHIGTLVKIKDVQFVDADLTKTYGIDKNDEGENYSNANRTLTNIDKQTILMRSSQFSKWANTAVTDKSGSVTAILGKFGSDYQLFLRSADEMELTSDRFEDPKAPFVNKTVDALNESFDVVSNNEDVVMDGWFTEATKGNRNWIGKEYSSNKYIQVSGYKSNLDEMVSYIVTPGLNLDAAGSKKNFTFSSKVGFSKEEVLKVYVSSNFDYTKGVAAATWEELTVTLPAPNASAYSGNISSGDVDLSAKTGTVHVAFVYTGNGTTASGTWQVDDVKFNYTATTTPEEPTAFSNWGFENWETDTKPTGFAKAENVTKESTIKHGGEFSAKQQAGTKDIAVKIPVEAGSTYKVSYWFLDNDTTAKARLWAKFRDADNADLTDDASKAKFQPAEYSADNAEWQQYSVDVTVPAGATVLDFEVRTYKDNNGTGFIYYDDFAVVKQ